MQCYQGTCNEKDHGVPCHAILCHNLSETVHKSIVEFREEKRPTTAKKQIKGLFRGENMHRERKTAKHVMLVWEVQCWAILVRCLLLITLTQLVSYPQSVPVICPIFKLSMQPLLPTLVQDNVLKCRPKKSHKEA